jgi:Ser-tRNA(Ala) deacylase AlaX
MASAASAAAAAAAPTALAYMDDTYAFDHSSAVRACVAVDGDAAATHAVELESTIVYPAGGGQPSDVGAMVSARGTARFEISSAKASGGVVRHYGAFVDGDAAFEVGEVVRVTIDSALRVLHARVHSAGHALDVAMIRVGLGPEVLEPTKGQHFVEGAYVEYRGKIPPEHELADSAKLMAALDDAMATLIAENSASEAAELAYEEAKNKCGGQLPSFITEDMSPRGCRVVTIVENTPGCPCGGTHVKSVGEIEAFKMVGVRVKKGVTRLSYTIPGMKDWKA